MYCCSTHVYTAQYSLIRPVDLAEGCHGRASHRSIFEITCMKWINDDRPI